MKNDNYFRSRFTFDTSRKIVWKSITNYLENYIKRNYAVLDLGAGYCDFINLIKVREKHALDSSEVIKKNANKEVICYIQSCTNLRNFKDDYFDLVFSSNLFEHLDHEQINQTLKEVYRILKNSGRIIIIQPNFRYGYREYFDDFTHKTIFTHKSLKDLVKFHGFNVELCCSRFLPFSMKSYLPKIKFLIDIYLRIPLKPFAKQMLLIAKKSI